MRCETCGTEYDSETYEACPECAKTAAALEPQDDEAPIAETPADKPAPAAKAPAKTAKPADDPHAADDHGHGDGGHPAKRSPGCLITFLVMLPLLLLLLFFLWVLVGAAMKATFGG